MKVFISGGSRGIGKAVVETFLKAGHEVAFCYRTGKKEADAIVEEAQKKYPKQKIKAYCLDISKSEDVDKVGEQVLADFGEIQALVCNAAMTINGLVVTFSDEDWATVLQTNLTGSFYLCRFFIQHFLENHYGRIVLVSSVTRHGAIGQVAYASAKAGLMGLGMTIAKEYGPRGITCNIVSPGYIDTELTQAYGSTKVKELWLKHCPVGRPGTPQEVAHSILHLCSEEASFINGAELPITGGLNEIQ